MHRQRRRLSLAFLCLAVTIALALAPATSGSGQRSFHDTVGEVDCCTRDLTNVVVRNDDAGTITFEIHFDDRVEGDDDDDLFIPLDIDRNNSTGESGDWGLGVDYIIGAGLGAGRVDGINLKRWTGTEFRDYPARRIHATVGRGVVRFALDRHLIGDTDGFDFSVQVWEVAQGNVYSDAAPDSGSWSFPLRIATHRLRPTLKTSQHPRAGHRFRARLALHVGRTRRLLGSGRVLCEASIHGAQLKSAFVGFAARHAVCAWNVPSSARGKTIRGSVGVAVTSRARITRRFAAVLG